MPSYSFTVQSGVFLGAAVVTVCADNDAARREALAICAGLSRDIVSGLAGCPEWRMEVADESGKPVFRFRLLAEAA